MKPEKRKKSVLWLSSSLALLFLLTLLVGRLSWRSERSPSERNLYSDLARVSETPLERSICGPDKDEAIARDFIYKIEENYEVYVQPRWYVMPFDWKRGVAAYIATCNLAGRARFLDPDSGELLARFGTNGYVAVQ